ncbi:MULTISPECIES: hypothetical protein [Ralstonia solanacearum species complex]|uniref:hypothetical protein n=1 Tax=Ralstonia solanacearum species complex TaxID=3116862 RepID=UPI0010728895|nr:hypothetical protein [Ralstonia solanacearum]
MSAVNELAQRDGKAEKTLQIGLLKKKGAGLCCDIRKQESLGCEECFDIAKPRRGVAKAR